MGDHDRYGICWPIEQRIRMIMSVEKMKIFRLLLGILLMCVFLCPSLQASVKNSSVCDHEQKSVPQKVMKCCDQQAIQAKELRAIDIFSVPESVILAEFITPEQQFAGLIVVRFDPLFWKTTDHLSALSLFRI